MRLLLAAKLLLILPLGSASRNAGNSSLKSANTPYTELGVLSDTYGEPHIIHIGAQNYNCKVLGAGQSGIVYTIDNDPSKVIKLPIDEAKVEDFQDEADGSKEIAKHGIKTVATSEKLDGVRVTYNGATHDVAGALIKKRVHGAYLQDIIQVLCLSDNEIKFDTYKPNNAGYDPKDCLINVPVDKLILKNDEKYLRVKKMLGPKNLWSNIFGPGNRRTKLAAMVIPQVKCMWKKIEQMMRDQTAEGYIADVKPANMMWDFDENVLYLVDYMYFRKGSSDYNNILNHYDQMTRGITQTWNYNGGKCLGEHWTDTSIPTVFKDVFPSQQCHEHHGGLSLNPKKHKKGHKQHHP
eukprot:jgi/Bigna1/91251/estExt_fgenesh1_pg.C_940031